MREHVHILLALHQIVGVSLLMGKTYLSRLVAFQLQLVSFRSISITSIFAACILTLVRLLKICKGIME